MATSDRSLSGSTFRVLLATFPLADEAGCDVEVAGEHRLTGAFALTQRAPLGWQHINLTGDYLWGADTSLGPDGFRPLKGIFASLPMAKALAA